jgi:hypothetical protein
MMALDLPDESAWQWGTGMQFDFQSMAAGEAFEFLTGSATDCVGHHALP